MKYKIIIREVSSAHEIYFTDFGYLPAKGRSRGREWEGRESWRVFGSHLAKKKRWKGAARSVCAC